MRKKREKIPTNQSPSTRPMKKRGEILVENLIFIILNLAFIIILVLFLMKQGSGATIMENTYSKQIALMIDAAKPGMLLKINLEKLKDVADKKGFKFENVVKIEKNVVTVKLSEKGGQSYTFFNDVSVSSYTDGTFYIFSVEKKK